MSPPSEQTPETVAIKLQAIIEWYENELYKAREALFSIEDMLPSSKPPSETVDEVITQLPGPQPTRAPHPELKRKIPREHKPRNRSKAEVVVAVLRCSPQGYTSEELVAKTGLTKNQVSDATHRLSKKGEIRLLSQPGQRWGRWVAVGAEAVKTKVDPASEPTDEQIRSDITNIISKGPKVGTSHQDLINAAVVRNAWYGGGGGNWKNYGRLVKMARQMANEGLIGNDASQNIWYQLSSSGQN